MKDTKNKFTEPELLIFLCTVFGEGTDDIKTEGVYPSADDEDTGVDFK